MGRAGSSASAGRFAGRNAGVVGGLVRGSQRCLFWETGVWSPSIVVERDVSKDVSKDVLRLSMG